MDENVVKFTHGDEDKWFARTSVLCACSPVFESILMNSDPSKPKNVAIDDVEVPGVHDFLQLASLTSYEMHSRQSGIPSSEKISQMTVSVMPLVHKYDCHGLLRMVQHAQNEHPTFEGISAIMTHEPESAEWIQNHAMERLILYLRNASKHHKSSIYPGGNTARVVDELPEKLARRVLIHMLKFGQ